MEHKIKDGQVVRLADLLEWSTNGTLRQSKSAGQIWVTIHFTKPKDLTRSQQGLGGIRTQTQGLHGIEPRKHVS